MLTWIALIALGTWLLSREATQPATTRYLDRMRTAHGSVLHDEIESAVMTHTVRAVIWRD